jgi:mannose-6-phosphate isomerase-like protein (cupin superfamily)
MTASFPGATGLTVLDVYDWVAPDGLRGGSAHVHLASAEGYLVLSGAGQLQTLGTRGYAATPLRPGDCVWFTPGTIHRLVDDGGLRLAIVMQNAGLPEHGDAVLTFPPGILADREAYAEAATLAREPGDQQVARRARRRASLAVEGYLALRDAVASSGPAALEDFFAAALRLKAGGVPDWRARWRAGALAVAEQTGAHLDEIAAGVAGHLTDAGLWRVNSPLPTAASADVAAPGPAAPWTSAGPVDADTTSSGPVAADTRSYGMCGRLTTYPASSATRLL